MIGGAGALVFTLVYLAVLVGIGVYASIRERREASGDILDDHELGGRTLPFWVLFGTLYATQYSGNSFVGFTGKAARDGYSFLGSAIYMQAVIVAYLLFAPKLFALSRKHRFRTPGDFVLERFKHGPMHVLSVALMIFALLNFLLSQLVAIGQITQTLGGVHPAWGIVTLALLMVTYETLGGMRAVAWTDMLQGALLFIGSSLLFGLLLWDVGGPGALFEKYAHLYPKRVLAPEGSKIVTWVGNILLLGVGASVYPHAIQRIYAARSEKVLRRSLAVMVFMPLLTTLPLFFVGICASLLAGGEAVSGDDAMPLILKHVETLPWGGIVALMVLAGAVSAMMSTADSALLTNSSIINRDVLERYLAKGRPASYYLRTGRASSWLTMIVLANVAVWCVANDITIWKILEIKLELLMQIAPAFWLGLHVRRLGARGAFAGMLAGSLFTLAAWLLNRETATGALTFFPPEVAANGAYVSLQKIGGLHAGLWGLALNLVVCGFSCFLFPARGVKPEAAAAVA